MREALAWYIDEIQYEEDSEQRLTLTTKMAEIATKANKGFVWELTEGESRGHGSLDFHLDIENRYHTTKRGAIDYALSNLYC